MAHEIECQRLWCKKDSSNDEWNGTNTKNCEFRFGRTRWECVGGWRQFAVKLWTSTKKLFFNVILTRSFSEIIVYSTRRNVILNSLIEWKYHKLMDVVRRLSFFENFRSPILPEPPNVYQNISFHKYFHIIWHSQKCGTLEETMTSPIHCHFLQMRQGRKCYNYKFQFSLLFISALICDLH